MLVNRSTLHGKAQGDSRSQSDGNSIFMGKCYIDVELVEGDALTSKNTIYQNSLYQINLSNSMLNIKHVSHRYIRIFTFRNTT